MSKRLPALSAACLAALYGSGAAGATLPAFPGADGFGANARGGRGGDVYRVTTLANDPNHLIPGSLYYGLYEKNVPAAGRTIVFDVGGVINLGSTTLDIKNISNVTIAGQTAPSPITLIGNTVQITSSSGKTTSNIILQHVNVRKGTASGDDAISIKGPGITRDIILDHVSTSWSEDELISVTQGATKVTVQNSYVTEAVTTTHAYGSLIRPYVDSQVSYHHNLYTNNKSRNPRPGTYEAKQLDFDFRNNVIYNWSDRAGYAGGSSEGQVEKVNMNYVGNYVIAGPSTPGSETAFGSKRTVAFTRDASNSPIDVKIYQEGNLIDSTAGVTRNGVDTGWNMFANWSGSSTSAFPLADRMASPFDFPFGQTDSAEDAYAKVLASGGAFPWARSALDQRLTNNVLNYTGVAARATPDANEWNAVVNTPMTTRPAGWDTDNDGMPNWWEEARGFNPNVADNNVLAPDGYTRLEKYLHYLNLQAAWGTDADGSWSAYLNWRGIRPGEMDSTAIFGNVITAPRTVTVDAPRTVGQIMFDSGHGYSIAGVAPITVDVISGRGSIDVQAGSHVISAPLALADNVTVTVGPPSSTLRLANLQASPATLTKAGAGTLEVNRVDLHGVNVQEGKLKIVPSGSGEAGAGAGASRVGTLNVAAGASIDVGDANLVVTGGARGSWNGSHYTGITGMIQSGRNEGTWDGSGIVTSSPLAANSDYATLGVATADELGRVGDTFGGVTLNSGDVLIAYTYGGDANLDGVINIDDYGQIDFNVGLSGTVFGYFNGDFNYDGLINIDDYGIIDFNIGIHGPPLAGASSVAAGIGAVSAVPEPASLVLVGFAAASFLRRRRRR